MLGFVRWDRQTSDELSTRQALETFMIKVGCWTLCGIVTMTGLYTRLLRVKSSVLIRTTGADVLTVSSGVRRNVYRSFRGEYRPWLETKTM
jgi:hypothetical protein